MSFTGDDALFRRMVENAPDAKLVVGLDGCARFANAEAERLLGRCRDAIVGEHLSSFVAPEHRPRVLEWWAGYVRAPYRRAMGGEDVGLTMLDADGHEVPVDVSLSPVERGEDLVIAIAVRDLTERRNAQGLFRDLLESAPDAMVIADQKGTIVLVNAASERMFGWGRDDLVGQPVEALLPEHFHAAHVRDRQSFVAHAQSRPMGAGDQLYAVRKDGEQFPVDVSLSPLTTPEGLLVSAAIRDVSERQRMREETEQMREEMIATVSHELRTPLTSIIGYTELLSELDDELGPHARKLLAVIDRNANRELTLVNDLLTLASLHTRQLSVVRRPVDVAAIVRAAAESAAGLVADAGLALGCDVVDVPLVDADPDRIVQVLDNLVGNACKFTRHGGRIDLRVACESDRVLLEVSDTGVGMTEDETRLAWERLYRSPNAVAAQVQGAGLGLSIVRAIVDAHEGSVELESTAQVGTVVRVRLPVLV